MAAVAVAAVAAETAVATTVVMVVAEAVAINRFLSVYTNIINNHSAQLLLCQIQ